MKELVELLKEQGLFVPLKNPDPKIIIQNEKKLAVEWSCIDDNECEDIELEVIFSPQAIGFFNFRPES